MYSSTQCRSLVCTFFINSKLSVICNPLRFTLFLFLSPAHYLTLTHSVHLRPFIPMSLTPSSSLLICESSSWCCAIFFFFVEETQTRHFNYPHQQMTLNTFVPITLPAQSMPKIEPHYTKGFPLPLALI